MTPDEDQPVFFDAVTSSARQLFFVLQCCGFQPRAELELLQEGVKVTVEESRIMTANIFVDKTIFSTYTFKTTGNDEEDHDGSRTTSTPSAAEEGQEHSVSFGISLAALLECLQIFGADTSREKWHGGGGTKEVNTRAGAGIFDQQVLKVGGTCRISYRGQGHPLSLMLEENGVVTTCELVTYEPEAVQEIPFAMDQLVLKIIMKSSWLYDAIQELEGSSVERLTIAVSPQHPYFSLSASGPTGSTVVEFSNDQNLLQSFKCDEPAQHTYKFCLVKCAAKAMAVASKVSIRSDRLGVLSMQFMIEQEGGGANFVDFRFMSLATDGSHDEIEAE
ncbi:Rad1/Rec1/Rad17 [Sphaerosporella brunnea]|uniref:Rad1/Rec1/Rad17 n=1 Tax=Sphaerosporella brunnea TaxID=1250544 RepID=A0A5J5EEW3_9PEZI|nr:Rad1/Rec1/Rad17 [Sphaerosporella brunnea]